MHVLIGFSSQTGHTRQAAEAIANTVQRFGGQVILKAFEDIREEDIQRADALFVGTWVQGLILFGVRPAGARQWVAALPSIAGKPVGVYCTYAFDPRGAMDSLCAMLETRGAIVKGFHAFHRDRPDEGVEHFVQNVLELAAVPVY